MEKSHLTHYKIYLKITRLVTRLLVRRNISSSKIQCSID